MINLLIYFKKKQNHPIKGNLSFITNLIQHNSITQLSCNRSLCGGSLPCLTFNQRIIIDNNNNILKLRYFDFKIRNFIK